jgi:raffinose/stachyose/melibiose transport system permease protein
MNATHRKTNRLKKDVKKIKKITAYIFLTFCAFFTVIPAILTFLISIRTRQDLVRNGAFGLPEVFQWGNYAEAWRIARFSTYFWNSVFVSVVTVAGVLVFSLFASYAFALLKFRFRSILEIIMMVGLVLPLEIVIIPLFYDLRTMGLLDTLWAVILPTISMTLAFGIFLLGGFIRDIPASLLESARIDGSNEWQNIYHIVIPLIRPALISLLIFVFMDSWNGFMLPNIMINSDASRTLPLGLDFFRATYTNIIPLTAAASNMIALPVIIIYLTFQRNMIRGLMVGAVKE